MRSGIELDAIFDIAVAGLRDRDGRSCESSILCLRF